MKHGASVLLFAICVAYIGFPTYNHIDHSAWWVVGAAVAFGNAVD